MARLLPGLVELVSAPAALVVDSITFVVSALFLRGIRAPEPAPSKAEERGPVWREIGDGVRFATRHAVLRPLLGSAALAAFSWRTVGVVYMLFVYRELGFQPGTLGMIFAVGAVSSLAGALVVERVSLSLGLGPTMIVGLVLFSLSILLLPLATGAGLVAALLLVAQQLGDGFEVLYSVSQTSLRQQITPDRVFGRVNASQRFASAVAMLGGVFVGGLIGETVGLRAALLVGGVVPLIGALWLLLSPVRSEGPSARAAGAAAQKKPQK